jgi:hypothetical protein
MKITRFRFISAVGFMALIGALIANLIPQRSVAQVLLSKLILQYMATARP